MKNQKKAKVKENQEVKKISFDESIKSFKDGMKKDKLGDEFDSVVVICSKENKDGALMTAGLMLGRADALVSSVSACHEQLLKKAIGTQIAGLLKDLAN